MQVGIFVVRECFFFQAEDGIRDLIVTGVQTCALPICSGLTHRTRTGISRGSRSYWPSSARRSSVSPGERRCPMRKPAASPSFAALVQEFFTDRKSVV